MVVLHLKTTSRAPGQFQELSNDWRRVVAAVCKAQRSLQLRGALKSEKGYPLDLGMLQRSGNDGDAETCSDQVQPRGDIRDDLANMRAEARRMARRNEVAVPL